jgi:threonine dehydratase
MNPATPQDAVAPPPAADMEVNTATIQQAATRIAGDIRHTPLLRLRGSDLGLDCAELWLKLEHLQRSGSFKARGMFNRMRSHRIPPSGVVIASGGNAGIAVATAALAMGVPCEVFVPQLTSAAKRAALAGLQARVVVGGATYAEALAASLQRQAQTGALLMHAYDQIEVVAGAGTLALEIEADAGVPDQVLVSVGGGGLIGGVAAWFAGRTAVQALEPVGSPTLHAAFAAGEPVDVAVGGLAADALGARRIGRIAWPLCQRGVAGVHLVAEADILAAQQQLWHSCRLAVEPAAALPLAALRAGVVKTAAHQRVALVLCGANFDPLVLATPATDKQDSAA